MFRRAILSKYWNQKHQIFWKKHEKFYYEFGNREGLLVWVFIQNYIQTALKVFSIHKVYTQKQVNKYFNFVLIRLGTNSTMIDNWPFG